MSISYKVEVKFGDRLMAALAGNPKLIEEIEEATKKGYGCGFHWGYYQCEFDKEDYAIQAEIELEKIVESYTNKACY